MQIRENAMTEKIVCQGCGQEREWDGFKCPCLEKIDEEREIDAAENRREIEHDAKGCSFANNRLADY
jgi:hypothetical protein